MEKVNFITMNFLIKCNAALCAFFLILSSLRSRVEKINNLQNLIQRAQCADKIREPFFPLCLPFFFSSSQYNKKYIHFFYNNNNSLHQKRECLTDIKKKCYFNSSFDDVTCRLVVEV